MFLTGVGLYDVIVVVHVIIVNRKWQQMSLLCGVLMSLQFMRINIVATFFLSTKVICATPVILPRAASSF